jgi:hypothetical protein
MAKKKESPLLKDGEAGTEAQAAPAPEVNEEKKEVKKAPKAKAVVKSVKKVAKENVAAQSAPAPEVQVPMSPEQKEEAARKRFEEELKSGPHTQFMIPLMPGEKPGAYDTVNLNGCRYTIKKGALVSVPVPIAEVLAEKYQVEMTAGQDKLADRNDAVMNALGV